MGFEGLEASTLAAHCHALRKTVYQWTGLPVSVGIAPTRTLAKLANRHAKRHPATDGVFMLGDIKSPDTQALLARTPVGDIWGVGGRVAARLHSIGIETALTLAQAHPPWIRQQFSVVLERTVRELCGVSCIDMNESPDSRKMIMTSRSFGRVTSSRRDIEEAVRAHASRSAQRLRAQRSLAGAVMVMLRTNPHMRHLAQDHDRVVLPLPRPTDNTFEIVATAQRALARLWKPHRILYQKCGVQLMDLMDVDGQQLDVFQTPQSDDERQRSDHLMATLDQLNTRFGRNAVTVGVQRRNADWQLRCGHRSNRWTTRWTELPAARLT
ncbi:DinB/UmuC family translesion DNA polymerase [Kushneria marisflavi]|uniref:DinB/UmuC family translesion DNA polymerase n=1 Tax=Kushneria marisflavi TaxID=157779 RepID=UPI001F3D5635|nr:DUF4113 domain-containing protein [Kushneria marisflavi]